MCEIVSMPQILSSMWISSLRPNSLCFVRKIDELHAVAGACGNVFVAVALARSVLPGDHNFQEIVSLGVQAQAARFAVVHVQTALVKGSAEKCSSLQPKSSVFSKTRCSPFSSI